MEKVNLPRVGGICDNCLRKAKKHRVFGVIITYCEHHEYGGVFDQKMNRWQIFGPVTPSEFSQALDDAEVLLQQKTEQHILH